MDLADVQSSPVSLDGRMILLLLLILAVTGAFCEGSSDGFDDPVVEHVNATVIEDDDLTKSRPPVQPTPEEILARKHRIQMLSRYFLFQTQGKF